MSDTNHDGTKFKIAYIDSQVERIRQLERDIDLIRGENALLSRKVRMTENAMIRRARVMLGSEDECYILSVAGKETFHAAREFASKALWISLERMAT